MLPVVKTRSFFNFYAEFCAKNFKIISKYSESRINAGKNIYDFFCIVNRIALSLV